MIKNRLRGLKRLSGPACASAAASRKLGFASINLLPFIAVLPLILYAVISHGVVVSRFEDQEAAERRRDVRICESILAEECVSLQCQVGDYAVWDEMCDAIRRADARWIEENLVPWVPQHFGIQAVLLTDARLRVVASSREGRTFHTRLLNCHHIKDALHGKSANGLIRVGENIYLVAVHPVLPSDGHGPPLGTLTFAKRIDVGLLARLRRVAHLGISLYVDDKPVAAACEDEDCPFPGNVGALLGTSSRGDKTLVRAGPNRRRIHAAHPLQDWEGETVAALVTCTPRVATLANRRAATLRSLVLVAACLLAALLAALQARTGILAQHAVTDELTGLHNHRYLQERLAHEVARSSRYGRPLAVAMLDIDHFKHINDEYGHLVGDQALKQLAQLLRDTVRDTDVVSRYGGEEFLVIMPETRLRAAMAAAERVRRKVEATTFEAKTSGTLGRGGNRLAIKFTISIGVAVYPDHAARVDGLIMAADLALFAAKHASRNAVQSYNAISDQEIGRRDPITIHLAMREGSLSAVRALAAAVDARDHRMRGHSEKVALCALAIGQVLGLSEDDMNTLRTAALLHDVGRIAVPDSILRKPGKLTDDEREVVMMHSVQGAEILSKAPQLAQVATVVRHHHERFDGAGYPDGLAGQDIPLASRIIAAADAFDAITSERPHRPASVACDAVSRMKSSAGTQFDPKVLEALECLVTSGQLSRLFDSFRDELGLAA